MAVAVALHSRIGWFCGARAWREIHLGEKAKRCDRDLGEGFRSECGIVVDDDFLHVWV